MVPLAKNCDYILAGFYVKGCARSGRRGPWRSRRVPTERASRCSRAWRRWVHLTHRGAFTGAETPVGDKAISTFVRCPLARRALKPRRQGWCSASPPRTTTSSPKMPGIREALARDRQLGLSATSAKRAAADWSGMFELKRAPPGKWAACPRICFSFGEITPHWHSHGSVPREGDGSRAALDGDWRAQASAAPNHARPGAHRRRSPSSRTSIAAGLNSFGFLTGGGMGRALAHALLSLGVHRCDGCRSILLAQVSGQPGVPPRALSSRGHGLPVPLPHGATATARGPCRSTIASRRAVPTSKDALRLEGADWYVPPGVEPSAVVGRRNGLPAGSGAQGLP